MKIGQLEGSKSPVVGEVRSSQKNQKSSDLKEQKNSSIGAEVEISDRARLMKTAFDSAKNAPDVGEAKISAIKSRIKDGSYHVDSEKLAEKIIEDHVTHDFGKNNL